MNSVLTESWVRNLLMDLQKVRLWRKKLRDFGWQPNSILMIRRGTSYHCYVIPQRVVPTDTIILSFRAYPRVASQVSMPLNLGELKWWMVRQPICCLDKRWMLWLGCRGPSTSSKIHLLPKCSTPSVKLRYQCATSNKEGAIWVKSLRHARLYKCVRPWGML